MEHCKLQRGNVAVCLALILGLGFLGGLGCGGDGPIDEPPPTDSPTATSPQGTSLFLQVVDNNDAPIVAAVSSQAALFPTDSSGYLLLEGLQPGRFHARIEAPGFAPASVVLELGEGAHSGYQVTLLPLGEPISFHAEQGGIIEKGRVRVTIPPNAIVDALGQPVSGLVHATLVPLDPSKGMDAMPGPLEGTLAAANESVSLESFYMAEVSLWSNGAPAQLAPGALATLEFVLPDVMASEVQEGDTIPAWWFDLDAGHWREDGFGTIQPSQSQPGKLAWIAEVSHFSWWNCDRPYTDKSCVDVLVVDDEGQPVSGALVEAEGLSYRGTSSPRRTRSDGRACIDIKRGASALVFIKSSKNVEGASVVVAGSQEAAACGMGRCASRTLVVRKIICDPGAFRACPYAGPAGTPGVGLCRAARQWCSWRGTKWNECRGEVLPAPEVCRLAFDEDCDGEVDEGCVCEPSEIQECPYSGPAGTLGKGMCKVAKKLCGQTGTEWGPCQGEVVPGPERCDAVGFDEDCDGEANEVCACSELEGMPCYTGPAGTEKLGICGAGAMACDSYGTPFCMGQQLPREEDCATLADDDCDGSNECSSVTRSVLQVAGAGCEQALDFARDGEGNLLLLGAPDGFLDLGGTPLTGDADDLFVAKFDATGRHLWSRLIERAPFSQAVRWQDALSVDGAGNVLISGGFSGSLLIGGSALSGEATALSSYVLKLSPAGELLWAKSFSGEVGSNSWAMDVTTTSSGDVVLAGWFQGSVRIGSQLHSLTEGRGGYVSKLDASVGTVLWSRSHMSPVSVEPRHLAVGADGNILLLGQFESYLSFGGHSVIITSFSSGYLVKLDGHGGGDIWLKGYQPSPITYAMDLRLDGTGHAWAALWSVGYLSLYKIDAGGGRVWSRGFSVNAGPDDLAHLSFDAAGNAVFMGAFQGSVDLGGGARLSPTGPGVFLAWYDARGGYLADRIITGPEAGNHAVGRGVEFDSAGEVWGVGRFEGSVDFGTGPVQSQACSDVFLMKIDPTP